MSVRIETYDFDGGLKLEMSQAAAPTTIETVDLIAGDKLHIPLNAHIGNPSQAVVEVGQHVRKYETLAAAQGHVSVSQHAPSSGVILSVPGLISNREELIEDAIDMAGENADEQVIVLACDGLDETIELPSRIDLDSPGLVYSDKQNHVLYQRISAAGIIGMGGAGFPAHVKLKEGMLTEVSDLIINGVECDPLSCSDIALIDRQPETLILAAEMLGHLLSAKRIVLALNSTANLERLAHLADAAGISIVVAPERYPAGSEKQLIKIVSNKELPLNKLPIHIGVVCFNVATIMAMYEAASSGKPSVSRVLTLNGVKQTAIEAPIGLPVCKLVERVSAIFPHAANITTGGRMMSRPIRSQTTPVNKATTEISVVSHSSLNDTKSHACVRCGECVTVCPMRLQPQKLFELSQRSDLDGVQDHGLFDCIECGCCDYVCPSEIPLVANFRDSKRAVNALADEGSHRAFLLARYQTHLSRQDNTTPAERNAALADMSELTTENIGDELEKLKARLGKSSARSNRD